MKTKRKLKRKKKQKRKRKIQNESDNNADNSSLKAALRQLANCTPETRMPVFRYPLLSKIATERLFSICDDMTVGKWNRMAKTLNFAYFSE